VIQKPVKTIGKYYLKLLERFVGGTPSRRAAIFDRVTVPIIDPSVYLARFNSKLDYGDSDARQKERQKKKVESTANYIIKFMERDWISVGRRPNGLCGSALLIASYFHGFQVSAKEIADVVRMSEGTLKLRLTEMRETSLSRMSKNQIEALPRPPTAAAIEDLDKKDEERPLPPCLIRSRRLKAKAAQAAILDGSSGGCQETDDTPAIQDKVEKSSASSSTAPATEAVATKPRSGGAAKIKGLIGPVGITLNGKYCRLLTQNLTTKSWQVELTDSREKRYLKEENLECFEGNPPPVLPLDESSEFKTPEKASSRIARYTSLEPSEQCIEDIAKDMVSQLAPGGIASGQTWTVLGGSETGGILVRDGASLDAPKSGRLATGSTVREIEMFGDRLNYALLSGTGPETGWVSIFLRGKPLLSRNDDSPLDLAAALEPLRAELSKRGVLEEPSQSQPGSPRGSATPSQCGNGKEETLSDVDDAELEAYLLDEEEQRHKSDIWHEVNKGYLREWHERAVDAERKRRDKKHQEDCAPSETGSRATSGTGSRKSRRLNPPAECGTQAAINALRTVGKVAPSRIDIDALADLFKDD
jgi:hypothetical protein